MDKDIKLPVTYCDRKLSDILPDWLSLTVIPKLWINKSELYHSQLIMKILHAWFFEFLTTQNLMSLYLQYIPNFIKYTHIHKLNWVTSLKFPYNQVFFYPVQLLGNFFQYFYLCILFLIDNEQTDVCEHVHVLVCYNHNTGMISYRITINWSLFGYIKAHRDIPLLTWTVLSQPPEIKMWGKFGWYWAANTRKWCPSILSLESLPK